MMWLADLIGLGSANTAVYAVDTPCDGPEAQESATKPGTKHSGDQRLATPAADSALTEVIADFNADQDSVLFVWDDSETEEEPTDVTVRPDPANAGQLQVWQGTRIVAQILGREPLSTLDIALIPYSSARELALVEL